MKIAILITDNSELMETIDPYDILSREKDLDVHLISMTNNLNLEMAPKGTIIADVLYKNIEIETYDVLILPGGAGHKEIDKHKDMDNVLKHFFDNGKIVAAICAAPSILGKRGYLKNKNAISWHGVINDLSGANIIDKAVVIDGNIITSRNNMTSAKFGIEILRKIKGDELAKELELKMK